MADKEAAVVIPGLGTVVVNEEGGSATISVNSDSISVTALSQFSADDLNSAGTISTSVARPNKLGMGLTTDESYSQRIRDGVKKWLSKDGDGGVELTPKEGFEAADLALELQASITRYAAGMGGTPSVYSESDINSKPQTVPNKPTSNQR